MEATRQIQDILAQINQSLSPEDRVACPPMDGAGTE